jgi:hypothetical protein
LGWPNENSDWQKTKAFTLSINDLADKVNSSSNSRYCNNSKGKCNLSSDRQAEGEKSQRQHLRRVETRQPITERRRERKKVFQFEWPSV